MFKIITGMSAAALLAGFIVLITVLAPAVEARTPPAPGVQQPLAKGDRLDVRPLGAKCSPRAWPYFDQQCLLDTRLPLGEQRTVRMIATDRPKGETAPAN